MPFYMVPNHSLELIIILIMSADHDDDVVVCVFEFTPKINQNKLKYERMKSLRTKNRSQSGSEASATPFCGLRGTKS